MYQVFFVDGQLFQGGKPANSKWNEMPSTSIKKIIYRVNKHEIILENYEAYNHLVERAMVWGDQPKITKVILMALKDNEVTSVVIDFVQKKCYCIGSKYGKEYYMKSTTGWKEGLKGLRPKVLVNKAGGK